MTPTGWREWWNAVVVRSENKVRLFPGTRGGRKSNSAEMLFWRFKTVQRIPLRSSTSLSAPVNKPGPGENHGRRPGHCPIGTRSRHLDAADATLSVRGLHRLGESAVLLYRFRQRHPATVPVCGQAAFFAVPCGSITNFLAAPLSKSLYPCGASSNEMMVALHALAG